MHVIIVSQYFPPECGAVRYSQQLARGLASRGHRVRVIAGLPHYPTGIPYEGFGRWKPVIREEDGFRVIRTPLVMGSNRQPLRRLLGFFTFMISALPWILRSPRPDIVIASVPPATVSVTGLIGSLLRRCPLIVLLRDIEPARALRLRGWSDHPLGRVIICVFLWVYRRVARVVVVDESEKEVLLKYQIPADRIAVIPHGLDLAVNEAQASSPRLFVLPRRSGRSVALYAGTIGMVHNLTALVAAAADDRIRSLPVDFVIVGDGEYRTECLELIESLGLENVAMLPQVPPESVLSLLAQADILICSYRDEADGVMGAKICEYCAAGKPILIHGSSLAAKLVGEIGNGLACTAGDPGSLRTALLDFLSRPEFWRERGRVGQRYAETHFCQGLRDDQWESLVRAVVEAWSPTR